MLTALGTGLRFRFAITLAAFAAVCFVLPPAALAFGHGANTVKCLSHADAVNHGMGQGHGVMDQVAQDQGGQAPPASDHPSNCCGLFCLSALAADGGEAADRAIAAPSHFPAREPSPLSCAPERPFPGIFYERQLIFGGFRVGSL